MDPNPMVSIPLALGITLGIPLAVLSGIALERHLSGLRTPQVVQGIVLVLGVLVLGALLVATIAWLAV